MFGDIMRSDFKMMLDEMGGQVAVFKHFGTAAQEVYRHTALKGGGGKRPDEFAFLDRIEIELGDKIQVINSNDLWEVTGTSDEMEGNTLVCFHVQVIRWRDRSFK